MNVPVPLFREIGNCSVVSELGTICISVKNWSDIDSERMIYVNGILGEAFKCPGWKEKENHLPYIGASLLQLCDRSSTARELAEKVVNAMSTALDKYREKMSTHCSDCSRNSKISWHSRRSRHR